MYSVYQYMVAVVKETDYNPIKAIHKLYCAVRMYILHYSACLILMHILNDRDNVTHTTRT